MGRTPLESGSLQHGPIGSVVIDESTSLAEPVRRRKEIQAIAE